jgi:outer membrane protein OmpA-like peptidoglycan-associated protein
LPEAQDRLSQVAEALLVTPGRDILVEGYTDSRGSEEHNLDLSRLRAMAVRNFMIARGYPEGKVHALGFGKENPVADNSTSEGRANNRRVEIVVEPPNKVYSQRTDENR